MYNIYLKVSIKGTKKADNNHNYIINIERDNHG